LIGRDNSEVLRVTKGQQTQAYLCLYGHFYQPPRDDPFTGKIPLEPGAAPYQNFNEKITAECYRPNAQQGNFELISYDLGPTLASWLAGYDRLTYQRIIAADQANIRRWNVSNALAQAYNHTILPLATARDKRTQILWGIKDFMHRYGHRPEGLWLPETAVDEETLAIMADEGITYTVLAPWQAATSVDPTEPYRVKLPNGRSIAVFFYNAPLSGGVSFDWDTTSNADLFAAGYLSGQLNQEKCARGEPQLIVIATDGELYGHHKPWRDRFLSHLGRHGAPEHGFTVCSLGRYLHLYPPQREIALQTPSSWSCHHGVARWSSGCSCTEGDSSWKPALRHALEGLAQRGDALFEQQAGQCLTDPWAARNDYLDLRQGWIAAEAFWERHGRGGQAPERTEAQNVLRLLEAEYYLQCSFTSCGFFFEDLDRIEPRNDIAFARRAISLLWQATRTDLQTDFLADLEAARSWRINLNGRELYTQLPPVARDLLPFSPIPTLAPEPESLDDTTDTPAA
jgi:alpha-amylase/alpha-mannosidase (GH57 family)